MALIDEIAVVLANDQVGPRLYLLSLEAPQIAASVLPGQFVHMKLNGLDAHILRRPFSIYAADAQNGTLTILYQVVGQGTEYLATVRPAAELDLIGPVGHGWTIPAAGERVLIVGGGVGAAPLFMLAQQALGAGAQVDVVLGSQTKDAHVTLADYEKLCPGKVTPSTDDGSLGFAGFATEPARELLTQNAYDRVYVCGPQPLMRAVASLAAEREVACEVSMEKRMACGVGACLSCIVETVDGRKRACVDGPVFPAEKVVW